MRKNVAVLFLSVALLCAIFGFSASAHATTLTVVGSGVNSTDGLSYQLIYDSAQKITWYEYTYTNKSQGETWSQATSWVQNLTVTVNGQAITGWTLPTTPGTTSGPVDEGQMGLLYYTELGKLAYPLPGPVIANQVPFTNLLYDRGYWTGTAWSGSPIYWAWTFDFYSGDQDTDRKGTPSNPVFYYALAVHSGYVGAAVPLPGALLLFGPGLAGLAAIRRRFKK